MSKWHINDKGDPGECSATKGECPFKNDDGSPAPHYDTAEEARIAFEKEMEEYTDSIFNKAPGEKELAHPGEMKEKGWSRWAIQALGADHTLVPALGEAFLEKVGNNADLMVHGQALTVWVNEPDFSSVDQSRIWWKNWDARLGKAFDYLSDNQDLAFSLKDENGHVILSALGEGLKDFGQAPMGWPCRDEYDGDEGYEKWRHDLVKHGEALSTGSVSERKDAFVFLKKWVHSIWD